MTEKIVDAALKIGKATGAFPLAHCSLAQASYRILDRMLRLSALSKKSLEFIHDELSKYPGTIEALENFYLFHGCFPSELDESAIE